MQDAADGGDRWGPVAFLFEVPGDGGGAVVEAFLGQPEPAVDDAFSDGVGGGGGVRQRSSGSGIDGVEAGFAVAGEQSLEVASAVAVLRGGRGDSEFLGDDFEDSDPGFRHGRSLILEWDLCRDS